MDTWRLIVLLLGPAPIVLGCLALSRWAKPSVAEARETNRVTVAANDPGHVGPADFDNGSGPALAERCRRTAEELRWQLGDQAAVLAVSPFVLAGNLPLEELAAWHRDWLYPATEAFVASYGARRPSEPIRVLLWSDETSYAAAARKLFGDQDLSIYGYYRPHARTLMLNTSTGAGTLVHELTHALVHEDFPAIPDWFNEGLAALHEECHITADSRELIGRENWRLPVLQRGLSAGELPPLADFMEGDFRAGPEGQNYAQARYLCLYLQRAGRLVEFYTRFRRTAADDPQGVATLAEMLGPQEWSQLDASWRRWAAGLSWEPRPASR